MKKYIVVLLCLLVLFGCKKATNKKTDVIENKEAKSMLQGIWVDEETDEPSFRAKGDTIYYPDSTSQPAYFKIVGDTLIMRGANEIKYPISKQAKHIFWFKNQNGDEVHLRKSDNPDDIYSFTQKRPLPINQNQLIKRDTVLSHSGERYHCYVAINPTSYKVTKSSYNDDGVEVDNIFYDNIIHLSIFNGARQVYSRDFKKQMFAGKVPANFLSQSILSDMQFDSIDESGIHYNAIICIPDDASNYIVTITVDYKGAMKMNVCNR